MSRASIAAVIAFVVGCHGHHDEQIEISLAETEALSANAAAKNDPPPPEATDNTGGGQAMALDESAMARQQALDSARSTGVLGSSALVKGGAFASITGSGVMSSGFDSTNVWGPRKIVHTASIRLVVSAYDPARRDLEHLIAGTRGYIASTVVHHRQGTQSDATIAVRVPADHVQSFVVQLAKLGEVVGESTEASEITADYTDTAARLASAKTLEKRLLQLVAEGRGRIEDVLSVERELARVRGDIEALEAKIRQWDNLVAMATVAVELTTKRPELPTPPPPPPPTFGDRVDGAFHDSIDSVRAAGVWLALNGIAVLPWFVLAIPGIVLLRRWTRRVRLPWAIARRVPAPPAPVDASAVVASDTAVAAPSEAAAAVDAPIPPA
jgi:Domain of unknown function (DUF4349)